MAGKQKKFGPRLTVSLTRRDYDALSTLADKEEHSVSWIVRRAIEKYLVDKRGIGTRTSTSRVPAIDGSASAQQKV